jgi:hypothetical protein
MTSKSLQWFQPSYANKSFAEKKNKGYFLLSRKRRLSPKALSRAMGLY